MTLSWHGRETPVSKLKSMIWPLVPPRASLHWVNKALETWLLLSGWHSLSMHQQPEMSWGLQLVKTFITLHTAQPRPENSAGHCKVQLHLLQVLGMLSQTAAPKAASSLCGAPAKGISKSQLTPLRTSELRPQSFTASEAKVNHSGAKPKT